MADHVGVGEVDDPEAVAVRRASAPAKRRRRRAGAHLRLVVVGRDVARRVDQAALLPLPLLLAAAVEEVGDVRVLLGLGDVQLAARRLGDHLGERRLRPLPRGRRPGRASPCGTRSSSSGRAAGRRRAANSSKPGSASATVSCRARSGRKLTKIATSPVGHAVVVADHGRLDELVGLAALVGVGDRLGGARRRAAPRRGRSRRRRASIRSQRVSRSIA